MRQRRKLRETIPRGRQLRFEALEVRRLLSLAPIISEVGPANSTGIVDTLGNTADWLEIYNPDPTTAANLGGWSISYLKTGGTSTKTWNFPANTILGPGEFRVVFGDSNMTSSELNAETALGELDTGYNLSKSGATLTLWNGTNGTGNTISTLTYPALTTDTSYGPLTTVNETDLVAAGATASYYCPTSNSLGTTWTQPGFNDSSWTSGPTGLGFASVSGFACTLYHSSITVGSVAVAEQVISTPADQSSVINATEPDLDFMDTGPGGHFTSLEQAFPGMTIGEGLSNYVLQATGTITITSAQAGNYTFGVNSDDGFSLTIAGADFTTLTNASNSTGTNTMAYSSPRGPGDTLGTTYLAAGTYPVSLVYYQDGGGASMEFYAAKESSSAGATSFDSNSILVGSTSATTASGGTSSTTTPLAVSSTPFSGVSSSGAYSAAIATNVKSAVESAIASAGGTSLYTIIPFNASDLSSLTSLTLKMQYADGYVAWLNGVEVASENAPNSPTWDSLANSQQTSGVQATTYEDVDLSSFLNSSTTGHLTATGNVLAIQVLMHSYSEQQILVLPELAQMTSVVSGGDFIFSTPSPGAPNTLADVQSSITFGHTDGLYSASFPLTLTSDPAGEPIYYTTNNAAPGVQQAVSSITYSGTTATVTTVAPFGFATGDTVQIAGATPSVYDGAFVITVTGTNTFTYTSTPSANASGAAITATSGTLYTAPIAVSTTTVVQAAIVVGGVAAPYQTQTYVFPAAVVTQSANSAETDGLPSVWDGTVNSQDIAADYAMASVPGYTAAQIASALSSLPSMSIVTSNANMFGPSGIYSNSENHDLEVPGSLEYFNPLSGTTAWSGLAGISMYGGVGRDTQYLKHSFQIAFDQTDGPSYMDENIFGDGYLPNGLVLRGAFNDGWSWGGANTQFIIDQWTRDALTALGTQNTPGIWVQLYVNGQYWGMYNAVAHIDSAYAAYFFGGQGSDYDVYHYSSDGFEVNSGTMTPWDDLFNVATYGNIAGTGTASPTVLANPTAYALMSQYLNLPSFCDYIIVNYYGANQDWDQHNYSAIYSPTLGFVFQDWDGEGMLLNGFNTSNVDANITNKDTTGDPTQLFVQLLANPDFRQMFADHVYKDLGTVLSPTNATAMYQTLANTVSTAVLDESARWGNLGELDGMWDEMGTPDTWDTQLNTELGTWFPTRTAEMFTQFETAVSFTPVAGGNTSTYTYTMYPSIAPPTLYVNGTEENGGTFAVGAALTMSATTGTIYYTTDGSDPRTSSSGFTVSSIVLSGTTATVTLDDADTGLYDGELIYISGASQTAYDSSFTIGNVTASSTAGTTTFTCTVSGSPTSPATLAIAGEPIIAATSVGGAVNTTAQVYTGAITLTQGEQINARVLSGTTWSALLEAEFSPNLSALRVAEVNYYPLPATPAEIAAGYVVSDSSDPERDFQFITIQNTGTSVVPLAGLEVSGGIDFTFPSMSLAAGAYVVVCADTAAFTIRYGAELTAEFGGNWASTVLAGQFADHHLSLSSDIIEMSSPNGGVVEDFTYQSSWYPQTAGGGFALAPLNATESSGLLNSSTGWQASGTPGGTPGFADPVAIPLPGAIVINQVAADPTGTPGDIIELANTTSQSISIGDWFLSDSGSNLTEYEIPAGATIAANGYYVLTQDNNFGFTLDPDGCTVYLSNNYNGQAGGYQESQSINAMPPGYSYGLYTKLDGGTNYSVSSITLSGTTATVTLDSASTILQNGDKIYIGGAAQSQYDGDFSIANVAVNSSSGTTTFTCTVTGSPTSPATAVTGESLFAALGSTNFTLLQTPEFGTLSGAANSIPYVSPLVTDEIMYDPAQPTAAEAADGYVDNDFEYLELYNRSSSPVTLSDYYVGSGIGYTPGWLPDGSLASNLTNSEFETLESGATATWSQSSVAAGSYTVYAHLNLYDGDNNPVSPDSQAQYTVTCDGVPTTVTVDQDQTPTTLSVTSLTYDNMSGLVTAAANNSIINNNSLVAGSIVHISGATPSQYDGTFVVQSATSTSFTCSLASGLGLAAATGTVTAGLNDVWISLGTYAASGTVSVELTRTTNAHPSEWTIAGGMELVSSQQTVVLGTPTFGNTNAVPTPPATLAPGQYAVIVSNYAAFEERYNPTGSNNILVLGVYSGHLSNSGDTVDIYQIGSRAAGDVTALNGYVPFYRVDHINYTNATPWPTAADGGGSALLRIHTADYGNDPINWEASNVGGTPGLAGLVLDTLPPTVPTNLAGQALLSPTSEIGLTWSASSDTRSDVAYYEIYRGGSVIGTSTTTSYVDTTIAVGTNYTYTVAAVNRDGYQSAQSASISLGLPSVISSTEPSSTQIVLYFSEPLTTGPATAKSNYSVAGMTVSSVAIGRHNTEVTLTLTSAMTLNSSYTVTMKNLTTVSGDQLPATGTYTFTYALPTWTATIYQANWGTLGSLTDATTVAESVDEQSWSQVFYPTALNFTTGNSTGLGDFTNDTLMPTQTSLSEDLTDIVITASADVYIPAAGYYTFDTPSDDGVQLTIPGVTFTTLTNATNSTGTDQMQYNAARGTADTLGVVDFPAAGYYPFSILYFNGGGPGSLELSAAAGSYTAFNSNFQLVGNSTAGGLPLGGAVVDTTTPPAPANLQAKVTSNNTQITLAWSPVTGLPSSVDHYNIYRNGSLYATSTTTSFTDTSGISSRSRYSYQVTAVNYDGVEGLKSTAITVAPAGIAAVITPSTTSVLVQFTEPVDPTTAQTVGNYSISGGVTVTAAVLQSDGYTVALTTSTVGTSSHTLTVGNVKTAALAALPTNFLTTTFTYVAPAWDVTAYFANVTLNDTIAEAQTLVSTRSEQTSVTTSVAHYVDYNVTGGVLHFPSKEQTLPGTTMGTETDNFAVTATGTILIPAAGTYTFGCDSDDGFMLTITAATFSSVTGEDSGSDTAGTNTLQYNSGRGVADTLGVVTFASAGYYPVSLLWFQGNGESACELYAASGSYTSFSSSMELVGDTADGGLSMGATYTPPPFTVGVAAESSNNASPALSGPVTDTAASVTVRVNGVYYAAVNNGAGDWSLPQGEISALGTGAYNVVATGVNTSGTVAAFEYTADALTVGTTAPTVSVANPTSPTLTPVNSIAIAFSEPVENFTIADLQLNLTVNGVTASEPLDGATLTTTNYQNWTLGNLGAYASTSGTYTLTVTTAGGGVTDTYGNVLSTNASTSWTVTQALTSITVQPSGGLGASGTEPFLATAFDQFGNPLLTQPPFVWSLSGGGSVSSTGVFTPVYTTGTETIQAASGSVTGSDSVTLPGPAQWAGTSGASWNSASSWTSTTLGSAVEGPGLRSVSGDGVVFNTAGGGGTVNLNGASPSVANVTFNSAASYTIAPGSGGTLQLANGAGTATLAVVAGSPTISAPLALGSNVMVLPAAGSQLTISGGVSGAGMLTVDSQGTVVLSGANSYNGGTTVSEGTLVLTDASAIASGTSLTIGTDASSLFGPGQTASIGAAQTSSAVVFAAAATSVPTVGVGARVISAVAVSAKPAAMSPVAIDAVFTSHRLAFGPAVASPDMAQSRGAGEWLAAIGVFANSSDNNQADSSVEALDKVLARFGL